MVWRLFPCIVEVRKRIGMVFQKPNPFPKSISENIAWGVRINGFNGNKLDKGDLVEQTLHGAASGEEVKSKLHDSALSIISFGRSAAAFMHCPDNCDKT